MEHNVERVWKKIVCPAWKEETVLICEWDLVSEKEDIIQRTLKQIDCHNRRLYEFGGADCNWACEKAIARAGAISLRKEWLWVCAVLIGGILWIEFNSMYVIPDLHLYGLLLFVGIPVAIGLMLYYSWKMLGCVRRAWQHGHLSKGVKDRLFERNITLIEQKKQLLPPPWGRIQVGGMVQDVHPHPHLPPS